MYFDKYSVSGSNQDLSYQQIFGDDRTYAYNGIPKLYYAETYATYNLTHDSNGKIEQSFIDDNHKAHGSILYPMMGDAVGQANDLMYLKNHSMIKTGLDFVVGALGMTSNP
jgi:hypothetical protein